MMKEIGEGWNEHGQIKVRKYNIMNNKNLKKRIH